MALFVRTSRTVQLTEAGSIVHEAAVEALGDARPRGDAGRASWRAARPSSR